MWPFTSSSKDGGELTKELSPQVQQFFAKADPIQGSRNLSSEREQLVLDKVAAHSGYNYDLQMFKQHHPLRVLATINCAELQQAVVECYRGWELLKGVECSKPFARASACVEIQQAALRRLHYDQCYSVEQCKLMRAMVDKLFTAEFGVMGDNVNEETRKNFETGLDLAFDLLWK